MKLYFSKGACSLVVRIVINELGLTSDFEAVDLKTKKTEHGKDFLKINPKGAVPVLALDDGSILTENAIILQYLADTAKAGQLLPALGDKNRYRELEWVNYVTTELHKGIGILFNPAITPEMKDTIFIPLIKKKFDYLSQQLGSHDYLLDDHFSLADAYLFVMLTWASNLGIDLTPQLKRYYEHLLGRKSIQQSLAQEGISIKR